MISVNNWLSKSSIRHSDKCHKDILLVVFLSLALLCIIGDFKLILYFMC
jgi:hypothetical protein